MLDFLGDLKRTHYAGELRATHADQSVTLLGWVHRRRDLGNLIFIDLRDRAGIVQVVFNKETSAAAHAKAEELRGEYVAAVEGRVVRRQKPNPELPTGEIEVIASSLSILNTAKTPPFAPEDEITAAEETRLRYRYLDLRRAKPHGNLALRHRVILEIRKALDAQGFYEVETPMLTRSTPEGARDYLVPSRVHAGQFYALPQSPQIFKQLLMIGGLDRYFQIARCFRDEDFRADRQAEFTQLDLEMSFVRADDIFEVIEQVMQRVMGVIGATVKPPFRRMLYKDALRRYGSDKPDLRFGMELQDVTQFFEPARATFGFEGNVYALVAPGAAAYSRKQLDELAERAKSFGAKALYTMKVTAEGVQSPLAKTLGDDAVKKMAAAVGAKPGDLVLAVAASKQIKGTDAAALVAGQLRLVLGEQLNLIDKNKWEFLWLTGFPLFEWSETENAWVSAQHPFTGLFEEDLDLLEQPERRGEIRSRGYDLVLNGWELGSGSVRIHRQDVQARVFRALGMTDEQARQRFGFFLDALTYGTPPHGGIALGLDRAIALLAGEKSIREVIAFPKTAKAQDLMADAPSPVETPAVEELELVSALPTLHQEDWELARLADRLLAVVLRYVSSMDELPLDSEYRNLLMLFLAAGHKNGRAAVRLAKAGFGQQAAILGRSLFEGVVRLTWISSDPKGRIGAFRERLKDSLRKFAKRARKTGWSDVDESLRQQLDGLLASGTGIEQPNLKQMAEEAGLGQAYENIYALLSQLAHFELGGLTSYLQGQELEEVDVGPSPEWVTRSLATVIGCTIDLLALFFREFEHLDRTEADKLSKEFYSLRSVESS